MQESSGSIDIKKERKLIPEKNVEVMPCKGLGYLEFAKFLV